MTHDMFHNNTILSSTMYSLIDRRFLLIMKTSAKATPDQYQNELNNDW